MDIKDHINRLSVGYLYWKNRDGRYLGCNDAFARFLRLTSPQEIIGKCDADFVSAFLLDDILKVDQEIINTGTEKTVEETILDFDEIPRFFLSKKAPLRDDANSIIGIVGTSIDITNYAEPKNAVFFHSTANLFWKDKEGKYLGCNEACAKLLKLNSPVEIIGKTDADFIPEPYRDEVLKLDQYVLETGKEQIIEEIGVDCEGNPAFYISKKTPLKDQNGNIIGLTGTSLDVTKFKQAEITKNEFFRNMSHDIMTPFTGILGISKMLYEEEADALKKKNLEYLVASSDRLLQLLKQILLFSEAGNRKIQIKEFDIYEVVNEVAEMLMASAALKKLNFSFDCPHKKIKMDRLYINRILINLVSNAVKFTHNGFVHIQVSCNDSLVINIQDSGIGIPANKLEIIFDKFQKLTESGWQPHFTGVGIGLYISREWARRLGGDITVASQLGVGTTFTFTQPLDN
jgi:two-component system aerobic respiration control sensor histidine kinase ArcB